MKFGKSVFWETVSLKNLGLLLFLLYVGVIKQRLGENIDNSLRRILLVIDNNNMNNWRLWKTSKTFILEVSLIVFDSFLSLWTRFISCTTKVIDFFPYPLCRFFFLSYWEIHLRKKSCAMVWLFFCFCRSSLIFFNFLKKSVLYKDNNKTVFIYIL